MSLYKSSLSTEMLQPQSPDDPVLLKLNDWSERVLRYTREQLKHKKSIAISKEYQGMMKEFETIVENRFGFPVNFLYIDGHGPAVLTVPPAGFNTIFKDSMDKSREEMNKHNRGISIGCKEALTNIDNALYLSKLKIDYKKCRIDGFKKGVGIANIILDPATVAGIMYGHGYIPNREADKYISKEELTAIMLHEIGHAFQIYANSHRVYMNSSVLMDNYIDAIEKRNLSDNEAVTLCYNKIKKTTGYEKGAKLFLDSDTSREKTDKKKIALMLMVAENNESRQPIVNPNTIHDNEALADYFVTMFGYGNHLVSGLRKLGDHHIFYENDWFITRRIKMVLWFPLARLLLPGTYKMSLHFIWYLCIPPLYLLSILGNIYQDTGEMYFNKTEEYDQDDLRFKRNKFGMIKALKSGMLNTEQTKNMLEAIDQIDRILAITVDMSRTGNTPQNIYKLFNRKETERVETERILENMMHNDLHAMHKKSELGMYKTRKQLYMEENTKGGKDGK